MIRTGTIRVISAVLALLLLATLPLLGGCSVTDKDAAETNGDGESAETTEVVTPTPSPTGGEADAPTDPSPTDDGSAATGGKTPATLEVQLVWVEAGENGFGTRRSIPYTKAVATATLKELLAGLTPEEKATWPALSSAIPTGTKLLGVTVSNGIAKVNFSKEFESGGGTFSVTARLAQVVFTLTQFPTVDAVEFYIEGVKVDVFSSEGLILDGPQTPEDYYDLLPMDA